MRIARRTTALLTTLVAASAATLTGVVIAAPASAAERRVKVSGKSAAEVRAEIASLQTQIDRHPGNPAARGARRIRYLRPMG